MQELQFFFSPSIKAQILYNEEIEPGRLLVVKVVINGIFLVFVNVYTPNRGSDRINIFNKPKVFLGQQKDSDLIILLGKLCLQQTLEWLIREIQT